MSRIRFTLDVTGPDAAEKVAAFTQSLAASGGAYQVHEASARTVLATGEVTDPTDLAAAAHAEHAAPAAPAASAAPAPENAPAKHAKASATATTA